MLEVVQKIYILAVQEGNEPTSLEGDYSSVPLRFQEGSQRARDNSPLVVHAEQNPANQAPRVVDDGDKFTKEKFIMS